MRFSSLEDWLAWQETLHPSAIDMGLERVARVAAAMGVDHPGCPVITVGGTNGKGSCVALLEAILAAAGYRVGVYTSPHLLRYNERVRVAGEEATEAQLCAAFDAIDTARADTSLTYFEFGTLAALEIFRQTVPDVLVLEVGLGGRLDAVNIIDADVALIASVDIDHCEYLGPDRESIGREKAGIFRAGRPAVYGEADVPRSVLDVAQRLGVRLHRLGHDYHYHGETLSWDWTCGGQSRRALPYPGLQGPYQLQNAAAVLTALALLAPRLPVGQDAVRQGLLAARMPGRFQIVPGEVELILDVAHNPHAARALARALAARPCAGRTHAVLAMLADKDAEGVAVALAPAVDSWWLADLDGARAQSAAALATRLRAAGIAVADTQCHAAVGDALAAARAASAPGDRIVVCGSFHTVAAVMAAGAPLPV